MKSALAFRQIAITFAVMLTVAAATLLLPRTSDAGDIEFSGAFNFNKSTYPGGSFTWTRRWGAGVSYRFFAVSEIELAFQDVVERNLIQNYEDTTFHDRIYSINWIQGLTPRTFPIQPYIKVGVGQLNRDSVGTYAGGLHPASQTDSLTGVAGAGLRLYFTRAFALRIEGSTYLSGARPLPHWKDNIGVTFGFSLGF